MATKKVLIIGREPKPEYRKEYDDLLKLSLLELKERYGEYKERAESKLKKVVNIIRIDIDGDNRCAYFKL